MVNSLKKEQLIFCIYLWIFFIRGNDSLIGLAERGNQNLNLPISSNQSYY